LSKGARYYVGAAPRGNSPKNKTCSETHPVTVTMVIRAARARGLPLPVTDTPQDKQ